MRYICCLYKQWVFVLLLFCSSVFAEVDEQYISSALSTINQAKFELGGELELEFVKTESDFGTQKPNSHFQIDTFYLYPKISFSDDNLILKAELAFKTGYTYIEELHATYYGLPGNTWVQLGLDDMFIAKYDRKTEAEVLSETAFYRSDDIGLQVGGEPSEYFYWRFSVTNGLTLALKGPSEDGGYPLLHDARNTSNSSALMTGLGLGYKFHLGEWLKGDVLPFYYAGGVSDADILYLQSIDGYDSNDDTKERLGSNFRFDIFRFTLIAQILQGKDGEFKRDTWFFQPSYMVSERYELVYRYMDLNVDMLSNTFDTRTWDRQQHVLSIISTLTNNLKIKTEYYVNDESASANSVNNDEFLIQFELKF